jgi:hypothetical protein
MRLSAADIFRRAAFAQIVTFVAGGRAYGGKIAEPSAQPE